MDYQKFLKALGFSPKEKADGIYSKKYSQAKNYCIEVDLKKSQINYGDKIQVERDNAINFPPNENLVTLECVDRLLSLGYKPETMFLEKGYPAGRGVTKYLDILVCQDETPYLMIECKTFGDEFDKELKNTQKNGGQLFTYFQQDTSAKLLMLYTSKLGSKGIVFEEKIIKTEDFTKGSSVKEKHKLWDKNFENTRFFENSPYDSNDEIFTKSQLIELTEDKGKKLFHDFATILRKHSVSDKPNAFNVIFNLFLAKLYDEQKRDDQELEFQWKEGEDPVDFQVRLHNLHKEGLNDFLKKEIEGIYDKDFDFKTAEERYNAKKRLLKFNKFFSIKEVFDDETFEQNQRVLKEVVKLIEKYQIRYPRRQKYLSEFFELLITTGLKQEVGQYFTPPTIAKFIARSLPLPAMVEQAINQPTPSLPAVIDYAAGSGHFITEILEEYQDIIENLDTTNFYPKAQKEVASWKADQYNWAATYVYGIEKDYRLVKVAKVGCYFYGDGLAQIILGDGLDSFEKSKSYIGLLKNNAQKPQFSVVVANPPYSVDFCKDDLEYIGAEKEFSLYKCLTDKSKEIECLFVERTKQLLKDGGVAGIILPNSILGSEGIYAKTREIILQHFEIIAITELGNNTFMATGTNTVVLFLRRRNNNDSINLKQFVEQFFCDFQDVNPPKPFNTEELQHPVTKYINHVWENISFDDYITFLKKEPNKTIVNHEIYQEYCAKIKERTEKDFWKKLIEIEKEKLYYFILTYLQKVVLVKTGEKDAEKQFLGYVFSDRKKQEGIHPFVEGKTVEECTSLFDDENLENSQKASSYIYNAFKGNFNLKICPTIKSNLEYSDLCDLIDFKTTNFDLKIQKTQKININYSSIWKNENIQNLSSIATVEKGKSITKSKTIVGDIPVVAGGQTPAYYHNESNRDGNIITISASGAYSGFVNYFEKPIFASDCNTVKSLNETEYPTKLIYYCLKVLQQTLYKLQRGQAQPHVYKDDIEKIKIPIFNKKQAKQILDEIEVLEEKAKTIVINDFNKEVEKIIKNTCK
jgi:type I restriction enzyme M protein